MMVSFSRRSVTSGSIVGRLLTSPFPHWHHKLWFSWLRQELFMSSCKDPETTRQKEKYKTDAKTKKQKKESLIWQICTLAMCGSIPPPIMFLLSTLMVKFVSFYCDIDTGAQMFALIQLWSIIQIMAINRRDILSIWYFREDSRKKTKRPTFIVNFELKMPFYYCLVKRANKFGHVYDVLGPWALKKYSIIRFYKVFWAWWRRRRTTGWT